MPPMTCKKITEVFLHIQETEYYNIMLLSLGGKFIEIVKISKTIEDALKTRKISERLNTIGETIEL